MGFAWAYIARLEELQLLPRRGGRMLDVGSSNVYFADAPSVSAFLKRHNASDTSDAFAQKIAHGSRYDPVLGGANETFLGEVIEAIGARYDSIDIAKGYRTTILDLNVDPLPRSFRSAFDLILNFGTTEHVLNQYNCFKVIHDAANVGGAVWHQVPASGHLNHGYFTYTGRFFFEIAAANHYEVLDIWFDGPDGFETVMQCWPDIKDVPAVERRLRGQVITGNEPALKDTEVPTISLNVIYRKRSDAAFRTPLEMSTSVGGVDLTVLRRNMANEGLSGIKRLVSSLRRRVTGS